MSELLQFPAPNNKKELFARLRTILKLGWTEMTAEVFWYLLSMDINQKAKFIVDAMLAAATLR